MRNLFGGLPIAPCTVVRALNPLEWPWLTEDRYRIGYYSRIDGLNCVWMVNRRGEYEQTIDQDTVKANFAIVTVSDEAELYADRRGQLPSLEFSL